MENLLKIRKQIKKRKPKFIQQDAHKKGKLKKLWKKPRGSDSKMRRSLRGYRRKVTKGYMSPRLARGKNSAGKSMVVVGNAAELAQLDKEKECIIISSGAGKRNKLNLVKEAISKGIDIENLKDPAAYVAAVEKEFEKRKEEKEQAKKDKEKKQKEKEAAKKKKEAEEAGAKEGAAEEKKSLDSIADEGEGSAKEAEQGEESKEDKEKKEKDKVLTKKDQMV